MVETLSHIDAELGTRSADPRALSGPLHAVLRIEGDTGGLRAASRMAVVRQLHRAGPGGRAAGRGTTRRGAARAGRPRGGRRGTGAARDDGACRRSCPWCSTRRRRRLAVGSSSRNSPAAIRTSSSSARPPGAVPGPAGRERAADRLRCCRSFVTPVRTRPTRSCRRYSNSSGDAPRACGAGRSRTSIRLDASEAAAEAMRCSGAADPVSADDHALHATFQARFGSLERARRHGCSAAERYFRGGDGPHPRAGTPRLQRARGEHDRARCGTAPAAAELLVFSDAKRAQNPGRVDLAMMTA